MINLDVIKNRELVSALADGQLRGKDFAQAVELTGADGELRAAWHAYHVVGEVLRSSERVACTDGAGFLARFQSRLAEDAGAQVAYKQVPPNSAADNLIAHAVGHEASANESAFAWKLTAGFASLAAVVAIGWSVATDSTGSFAGAQMAQAVPPAQNSSASLTPSVVSESSVMIRDPNLDALMAAHKQFGGSSSLQMPTGFLRNATFEGAAR